MALRLDEERRADLVAKLRSWFREHTDDEIGELRATLLIDFFLAELGPAVYNQGIRDAQAYVQEKLLDLEAVHWEPEGDV